MRSSPVAHTVLVEEVVADAKMTAGRVRVTADPASRHARIASRRKWPRRGGSSISGARRGGHRAYSLERTGVERHRSWSRRSQDACGGTPSTADSAERARCVERSPDSTNLPTSSAKMRTDDQHDEAARAILRRFGDLLGGDEEDAEARGCIRTPWAAGYLRGGAPRPKEFNWTLSMLGEARGKLHQRVGPALDWVSTSSVGLRARAQGPPGPGGGPAAALLTECQAPGPACSSRKYGSYELKNPGIHFTEA